MDLLEFHYRLHVHLDWTTVDEWIDDPAALVRLVWQGEPGGRDGQLIGVIGASPPLGNTSWLRMVFVHDDADPDTVIGALWPEMQRELTARQVQKVGVLMLRPWLGAHLQPLGFSIQENVVTLARNGGAIPMPLRSDLTIQHGDVRDLEKVVMIDHAAFPPIFRMNVDSLRTAIRTANSFTLASLGGQTIGYQISMRYSDGAHLARLATMPQAQGTGVGGALLGEMLNGFVRRGLHFVTVNTQQSNYQSLSLYHRYGFAENGVDYPVWMLNL
jgi:ribosomal protein S18 acetylase RimI-like enzyme